MKRILLIIIFSSVFIELLGQAPANDNCANASVISIPSSGFGIGTFASTQYNVKNATVEIGEVFHSSLVSAGLDKKSIWYKFTLPTARAVKVYLKQPSEQIPQNGAGFTVYKSSTCFPTLDSIPPAKLTPVNKFGDTYNPCLLPGTYYVQVGAKSSSEGLVYIELEIGEPAVLNDFDKSNNAYDLGVISFFNHGYDSWVRKNFDVGCQTIDNSSENCPVLGSDYTQSVWFVFKTDNFVDLIALRMGEQPGYFTGQFKVAYNIYKGNVRTTPYSSLPKIVSCDVLEHKYENQIPYRKLLCNLENNTYYSIQIFFHKNYSNSVFIELHERGTASTLGPNPSSLPAGAKLGTLPASVNGTWTNTSTYFACNSRISQNVCGTANPASGNVVVGGINYNLATWYTFVLDQYVNIRFYDPYWWNYYGKRLFAGNIETNCNLTPIQEFNSGDVTFYCLAPGTYSLQILGKMDTTQANVASQQNHLGNQVNISMQVFSNNINNDFLLQAPNKVDFVNKVGANWNPLPDDVPISASLGRFNCQRTVLPDNTSCTGTINRAMYREIKIGDADGDGVDDSGVLTISNGNWYYLQYQFYRGDANALATAQGKHSAGQTFTGLQQRTSCTNLYYPKNVCVTPGIYTLVSYGDDYDVGQTDAPMFRFRIVNSKFANPSSPNNMGDITNALKTTGSVNGTVDYISCIDNPLTIDGRSPCSFATKQIYRQFYISEPMILNIFITGAHSMRIFSGKISDGVGTLKATIGGGIGDIGCVSSYYGDLCKPFPAGWYTVVTYADGGNYTGPYEDGFIGQANNISIYRVNPPNAPQFNRPTKASNEGITDWGPNMGSSAYPQTSRTYTFRTEYFNCTPDTPFTAHKINACGTGYNRAAYYVFTVTQESFISISGLPAGMNAVIYQANALTGPDFRTLTPIQPCITTTYYINVEVCRLQPATYTLVLFANDYFIGTSVTPVLYVEKVETSRFRFAKTAYDFGVVPKDSTFHYGKVGDVNPLDPGRAPSNDFFSCNTPSYRSDPGLENSKLLCWPGSYPNSASQTSVPVPMGVNTPLYLENYDRYTIRRTLWYTYVIDGPGKVTVRVENKTPDRTSQYGFSIYRSDEDGNIDFSSLVATGRVDSTISQGLTFIDNNRVWTWWWCYSTNEVTYSIDACSANIKRRYYIIVDHFGYTSNNLYVNNQVEVAIKHEPYISLESKFDNFADANVINGLNQSSAPYTEVWLGDGTYSGYPTSYACATKEASDKNTCGTKTLWYKFYSGVSGKVRIQYEIINGDKTYNANEIMLFKEITPGNPNDLLQITPELVSAGGKFWGEACLENAVYYIMLTGCSFTLENVKVNIQLIGQEGDYCDNAVSMVLNTSNGNVSASTNINCHTIGNDFGEDGSNMGCLFGPSGYKSTWFKVLLNFTDKVDLSFQLSENTTALPHQIRYRVMYGGCDFMTAGPCNTDALTEFTLNCMMSNQSYYFVQVVSPANATGTIQLTVRSSYSPNQDCKPLDPVKPVANFTYTGSCAGDQTCFNNYSSQGDSIAYLWYFNYPNTTPTSTQKAPCYTFPSSGTYTTRLIVTNIKNGKADTVDVPVTIYPKPNPNITRDPSGSPVIANSYVDFFSNVTVTISNPPTTYYWNFDNGSTSNQANPEDVYYSFSHMGQRIVSLKVTNGTCQVEDTMMFLVGMEPIFGGGYYDGEGYDLIPGYCPIEPIFAGGNFDGESHDFIPGLCPYENVFYGGWYDGEAMDIIFGDCPTENVFAGGFFDGESMGWVIINTTFSPGNRVVCKGDQITITVTDNNTPTKVTSIKWYNEWGNLIATTTPPNLSLTTTLYTSTTIYARVQGTNVCSDYANYLSFSYAVLDPPTANAGPDKEICEGETVQIGTPATSIYHRYQWSPSSSLSSSTVAQPIANPSSTTTYYLTVTNVGNVCPPAYDTVVVKKEVISVEAGPDKEICPPNSTLITPTYSGNIESYTWVKEGSGFKVPVTIKNNGAALTNYQVRVTLNTASLIAAGKMRSDCGDLRVYDSDGTTPLDYWISDNSCNTDKTYVWIKVPTINGSSSSENLARGGTASASSVYWINTPDKAFDGDLNDGWGSNYQCAPWWLMYDFGAGNAKVVNTYKTYTYSGQPGGWGWEGYNPKSWTFEGSNDGTNWVVLHTVTDGDLTQNQWKTFSFNNTTPYRYYQMNISSTEGSCYAMMTELEFYNLTSAEKTIYLTYGNPSLTSASNGENVFEFFDDFNNGTTINTSKWSIGTIGGTSGTQFTQSGGFLNGGNTNRYIESNQTFTGNYIAECRTITTTEAPNGFTVLGFYKNSGDGFGILDHNGQYYMRNDGSWPSNGNYTTNSTYLNKVVAAGASSTSSKYNEITGVTYNFGTQNNSGLNAEKIRLSARYDDWGMNQNYSAKWDWIFVRKYVSEEPTIEVGNETFANVLATTPNFSTNVPGKYIITIKNGKCSKVDNVNVVDATLNAAKLMWRTRQSGNWNQTSTWQVWNGSSWVDASSYTNVCGNPVTYPTYKDSTIQIRNGHTVTFNIPEPIDETTIDAGGIVVVPNSQNLKMVDSSASSVVADITNNGTITIQQGGTFTGVGNAIIQNNGRINIAGTFNVAGGASPRLINDPNSVVAYDLAGDQTMWNGTYGKLEIKGGGYKSIGGTVTKALTDVKFFSGYILHDTRNFRLGENCTITDAGWTTGYFITNSSGTLIKENLGPSTGTYVIPIGHSNTSFNKLEISNSGTVDNFRFRVSGTFEYAGQNANDQLQANTSVNRTWFITEDVQGGSNVTLNLSWVGVVGAYPSHENVNFKRTNCVIGYYDATNGWTRIGNYGSASGSGNYTSMYNYSANNISILTAFAVGSCNDPALRYRTISNGNWSNLAIWQVQDNQGNWVAAQTYPSSCGGVPIPSSLSEEIYIYHKVNLDTNLLEGVDQVTIFENGELIVNQNKNLSIKDDKTSYSLQCNISFTYTQNDGGSVSFTPYVSNITSPSYYWRFGDGNTSNVQYPTHNYTGNGYYTVELTVVGTNMSCHHIERIYVWSAGKCNIDFNYTNTGRNYNFNVVSSSLTTPNSNLSTPVSLLWNFGDGDSATGSSVSNVFSADGVYNVWLTATDGNKTCRKQKTIKIGSTPDIKNYGKVTVTGSATMETASTVHNNYSSIFHYNGQNQNLLPLAYSILWIDGTNTNAANIKTLNDGDAMVQDELKFINGKIELPYYNLVLTSRAKVSGDGQNTGYVKADRNGFVVREFSTQANVEQLFPVGGVYYSPARLEFNNITTAGNVKCKVTETVHPNLAVSIKRYWTINNESVGFTGNYKLKLIYNDNDLRFPASNNAEELEQVEAAGKYNNISWAYSKYLDGNGRLIIAYPYSVDVNTNEAILEHTSFSDFTLLEFPPPPDNLPITLVNLGAYWNEDDAIVHWTTLSENNNAGFEVLRRNSLTDEWKSLGYVEGKGWSNAMHNYIFVDKNAKKLNKNVFYYRLKQINFDGTYNYTNVVMLNKNTSTDGNNFFIVYPNPLKTGEEISVSFYSTRQQKANIEVYNVIGQKVLNSLYDVDKGLKKLIVETQTLPQGVYFISLDVNNEIYKSKIVITK